MFNGVNKVCAQCIKECKEFRQLKIEYCPNFVGKKQTEATKPGSK